MNLRKRKTNPWGWLAIAAVASLLCSGTAFAADHGDSPAVAADPTSDIGDLYAWMSGDSNNVILALTVPGAQFSDSVQYVFHVESSANVLGAGEATDIICTFDTAQAATCWVGDGDYVTGDASAEAGLSSASGMTTVFAGLRNDPFFFNGAGFNATVDAVVAAAPNLTFDANGCPALDQATSDALVGLLTTGSDDFGGADVSTLVVEVDKTLINAGGSTLSVWAATYAAP